MNEDNEHSEEEDDDDDDDDYDDDDEAVGDSEDESVSGCGSKREYTAEEKEAEAAAIGYQVIGPLQKSDRVFKPYEPVFAVVQVRVGFTLSFAINETVKMVKWVLVNVIFYCTCRLVRISSRLAMGTAFSLKD